MNKRRTRKKNQRPFSCRCGSFRGKTFSTEMDGWMSRDVKKERKSGRHAFALLTRDGCSFWHIRQHFGWLVSQSAYVAIEHIAKTTGQRMRGRYGYCSCKLNSTSPQNICQRMGSGTKEDQNFQMNVSGGRKDQQ